mmetsp:Transcript_7737/g.20474  ORF Transcript_7737/g.20474 Transcript_7737/m.20474 type:complete len:203 (+) Transcript_7737:666-1274(+)
MAFGLVESALSAGLNGHSKLEKKKTSRQLVSAHGGVVARRNYVNGLTLRLKRLWCNGVENCVSVAVGVLRAALRSAAIPLPQRTVDADARKAQRSCPAQPRDAALVCCGDSSTLRAASSLKIPNHNISLSAAADPNQRPLGAQKYALDGRHLILLSTAHRFIVTAGVIAVAVRGHCYFAARIGSVLHVCEHAQGCAIVCGGS